MKQIIFVGGIHGVGKSFFCKHFARKYDVLTHSASELISMAKNVQFNSLKNIINISGNQDFLIKGIERLSQDKLLLLDGHFCLLNQDDNIVKIPFKTFEHLKLKAIIILNGNIEKIKERLKQRDNIWYDTDFLNLFQNEELNYSQYVAKKMRIPYFVHPIDSESLTSAYNFINRFLN